MKAIRIHGRGGSDRLVLEDVPEPHAGPGQLLVRVAAGGVIHTELMWDETYATADGSPRSLPIPGRDVCGVVEQVGADVTGFSPGDAVFGMLGYGRDGAAAEYTIAVPGELAQTPRTIDDVHAGAVPLSALTAWQGLFEHARVAAGQQVVVHGAAGGVGTYVVQLAHWAGARVLATASRENAAFVRELGADVVIDYAAERFDDIAHDVDAVFDAIGGDTLTRSWDVVKAGGHIVSIFSPPPAPPYPRTDAGFSFFIVEPSAEQLRTVAGLIDRGDVRSVVDSSYPLADFRQAYDRAEHGHPRGKVVLTAP